MLSRSRSLRATRARHAPPGDTRSVFVVEQTGAVRIVRDKVTLPRPFLDLRDQVKALERAGPALDRLRAGLREERARLRLLQLDGGERRHPDQRVPTAPDRPRPRRSVQRADPPDDHEAVGEPQRRHAPVRPRRVPLRLGRRRRQRRPQPAGVLRAEARRPAWGTSCGSTRAPAIRTRCRPTTRSSASTASGPEIWAYGLRNPWRFWIDGETGSMFVGRRGRTRAARRSTSSPRGESGVNFGWPCFEGSLRFDPTATCERRRAAAARLSARRRGVRGHRRRRRRATHGSRCSQGDTSTATSAPGRSRRSQSSADGSRPRTGSGSSSRSSTSFGVDGARRVYVMSLRGDVYRLDREADQRVARERSSAAQAAARSPSQIGVRSDVEDERRRRAEGTTRARSGAAAPIPSREGRRDLLAVDENAGGGAALRVNRRGLGGRSPSLTASRPSCVARRGG